MRIWLIFLLLSINSAALGAWMPPEQPDPHAILQEARTDAEAGRYETALEKHVWFHTHALEIEKSLSGVRLSFALGYWIELSKRYPPALLALRSIRDETEKRVRSEMGSFNDFQDVASIDEFLHDKTATTNLFLWLDQNNAALARQVYRIAQPALIDSKRFALCGKYLEPAEETEWLVTYYREIQDLAKESRRQDLKNHAEAALTYGASTLVALLVLNGRFAEADVVTEKVLKEWPNKRFRAKLTKARKGEVPPRWPSLEN